MFSLCFCNQFNSTLAQADDYFTPGLTVHQQLAQGIEEIWTAYPDTHNDHFWWLQRVKQYTHGDQNSDKIKLKISQKIVSPVLRAVLLRKKSPKYFETRLSQLRSFENFRGGSVDCLKITEDKSLENRVYIQTRG